MRQVAEFEEPATPARLNPRITQRVEEIKEER